MRRHKLIIRYYIFLILLAVCSCKQRIKEPESEFELYFYEITYNENARTDYSCRLYEYIGDTIKVVTHKFNASGVKISYPGENGHYLKSDNKVYFLKGRKSKPVLGEIVFKISLEDPCVTYFHNYHHQVKNCYKGLVNGNNYAFNSLQGGVDGFEWDIVLDTNYSLIEKVSLSPWDNSKLEKRIDKSLVPNAVLAKVSDLEK